LPTFMLAERSILSKALIMSQDSKLIVPLTIPKLHGLKSSCPPSNDRLFSYD
jgi:hypothetical protein